LFASSQITGLGPMNYQGESPGRTRILLADDNEAILAHVSAALESDYEIVSKLTDGTAVCSEVVRLKPDLTVLDVSMGKCNGFEIGRQLREQGYAGEIIFLTVHEDPDFVSAAFAAGGRGYVVKSRMNADLGKAVKVVLSRRIFISPPLGQE